MDAKLNHSDLTSLLAKETGMTVSKAELFTRAMFDLVIEGLEQDGIVKINGLGTFRLTDVASRSSVNVNTGEKFEIKGHKKLTFTPADALKESVNQPFAMFEPVEVDETYSDDANDADELPLEDGMAEDNVAEESVTERTVTGEDAVEVVVKEDVIDEETAVDEATDENVAEKAEPVEESIHGDVSGNVMDGVEEKATVEPERVVNEQARPEPVLVHVPKKNKGTLTAPEKKQNKSCRQLYITLFIILLLVVTGAMLFAAYFTNPSDDMSAVAVETVVETTQVPTFQENGLKSDEPVADAAVEDIVEPEVYEFVITKELAMLDLKDVTLADTVMYVASGRLAEHKVAPNETLTRIALKYYGDKKLWPYIVKYNSLARPDDLSKGMIINIPKLKPIN